MAFEGKELISEQTFLPDQAAASENNAVSDSDPQEYLPTKIAALGNKADGVFFSNILPSPSAFDYKNSTYAQFLKEREILLAAYLNLLCDGHIS